MNSCRNDCSYVGDVTILKTPVNGILTLQAIWTSARASVRVHSVTEIPDAQQELWTLLNINSTNTALNATVTPTGIAQVTSEKYRHKITLFAQKVIIRA